MSFHDTARALAGVRTAGHTGHGRKQGKACGNRDKRLMFSRCHVDVFPMSCGRQHANRCIVQPTCTTLKSLVLHLTVQPLYRRLPVGVDLRVANAPNTIHDVVVRVQSESALQSGSRQPGSNGRCLVYTIGSCDGILRCSQAMQTGGLSWNARQWKDCSVGR
jgi:hypothetical protein